MRIVYQIIGIAIVAAIAAFGSNTLRRDGILVYCPADIQSRADAAEKDPLAISLERAITLYKKNQAVFIDARPESLYRECHIKGAVNLPWDRAEEQCFAVFQRIPLNKPIITYCDGEACQLGTFLASFLRDLGYENARALHNGLTRWRKHGLPATASEG
jgi:rhodanese-related sulfurtransferase